MTTLVIGACGQVGTELLRVLAPLGTVVAASRSGQLADGLSCERIDLNELASLDLALNRVRPALVVNAAAYTSVDRAEQERDAAFRANAEAPGVIAQWCARADVPLVHYSTDYVFDGQGTRPYLPDDATAPLGVYGQSKLAGERAVQAAGGRHLIFRTAWVYAAHGHNFLRTMLRVGAERDVLRVVADQIGTPTPAALIADITAHALRQPGEPSGLWHLTAAGQTTWHGFAEAIFAQARARGLLARTPRVEAIGTADYPTPAKRPAYSRLDTHSLQDTFGVRLPDWQDGLSQVLDTLAQR
ncbi:dTDP-4-dehydrorhamnose reductase [Xanthomonas citri pv. fuscans CFBP 6996]|uniref:dTDP-4-dehydrorhamnose reductase n=1 Tax=Xanthomonas citri TaxID=346 RepID=UPI000C183638|nr:dTDP-4-dehydrorhamnose reductase [Xanthomonas citri]ATS53021.1 dTDP-4-dehydrorhamnose reductase [Xanthomonas citri pv. phaseoli var. fuscans]ATS54896.1 dTDP-4-dehydrorhamnose reductase [Xanthomonas citri pv. phaseoli var. fuscans]ATS61095.1 dTDP-4-dehydrorhamnose reductase [Xanthomonas citri pv. phaseoli var. fuscans]PTY29990.1 dTDP-4-dehydrorhamnose reductase [Xanthomonas citri pv. fuscans CFBP 6996]QWN17635.1 dTDP-4-dehydrorhamnose reductase [Xanthomonas citri]